MADGSTAVMSAAQKNMSARASLINTGLYMTKQLQPVTATAMGQTMRINLERVGVTTGVVLDIAIAVNVTVAATASPFGPYNAIKMVKYTDVAGLQRVATSGYQLHALTCFRGGRFANNSEKMMGWLNDAETGVDTNILALPTAAAKAVMYFSLYVPMAYDPRTDLRGAILAQTVYGDHYITLDLASDLVATDTFTAPYSAGTVALDTANITVTGYQQYIMPQNGVANLPMIDLSTVYAIEGNYTDTSNIAASQSKYLPWPNNRAIMSAMHIFENGTGGVANQTDVTKIVLIGNSNTNIREFSPKYLRRGMRYALGADLPSGVYYIPSRHQPITTQLYGNVQSRFDIATANADPYFVSQYESTYLSGTPLPGIVQ